MQVDPKEVNLSPELVDMLRELLADLNITPMPEVHTQNQSTSKINIIY